MAQKRKTQQEKRIADAALSLADVSGWAALDMTKIARKAKVSPAVVRSHFSDIWDILLFVLADLERETQDIVGGYLGDSWRDNLMEILMTRFDIAGRHEKAFASLAQDLPRQPRLLRRFAPVFYATMDRMLKDAGVKAAVQPVAVACFAAVYLSAVQAWITDETRDKSKTMSVIDRRLDLFERALDWMSCGK